jgi:hypothetical protein
MRNASVQAGIYAQLMLPAGRAVRSSWVLMIPATVSGVLSHSVRFGLLLWLSAATQFLWKRQIAAATDPTAGERIARQLARQIYGVLYVLAATEEWRYFALAGARGVTLAQSMQALQPYIGYGLIALFTVKTAAHHRSR